ncbi:MAG: hypothetical protein IJA91_00030 [Clostridia bacterium]|nr:hypothetical protein [Clostridia bacterium]
MGRNLGYFDSDELDRPELNKCPECECYFATEECPLCGKICPEEMRAGNRAKVKPPKKRRNSSGRVQFIPFYHTWWFILIAFLFSRLLGVILFLTSPYSKKAKIITVSAVVGGYVLLFVLGSVLLPILWNQPLVNDRISREEYVQLCETMSAEEYCRDAYNEGNYVTLELVVEAKTEVDGYMFYLCTDRADGDSRWKILVMDCSVDKRTNYIHGDMIRVYGECSGIAEIGDGYIDGLQAYADDPLLYMAYSELIG